MDRNKFVSLASLIVYLTGSMPIQGTSFESGIEEKNIVKDLLIPNIKNNFEFGLRESCSILTIVSGIVLIQYNATYDRRNAAL